MGVPPYGKDGFIIAARAENVHGFFRLKEKQARNEHNDGGRSVNIFANINNFFSVNFSVDFGRKYKELQMCACGGRTRTADKCNLYRKPPPLE